MIKLVIVEHDVNFPTVLGRLNIPRKQMWPAGANIAKIPSVIANGLDRSFLPQILPPRGTGLLRGTAGPRRGGMPRGLLQRFMRHKQVVGQELSIDGEYATQVHNAVSAQTEYNIPRPWGPRRWSPGALIQNLPSVVQTGAGGSGPTRTMHPKLLVTGMSVEL